MLYFLLFCWIIAFASVPLSERIVEWLNIAPILSIMAVRYIVGIFVPFLVYLLLTRQTPKEVLPWAPFSLPNISYVIVVSFCLFPLVYLVAIVTSFIFAPLTLPFDITETPAWASLVAIGVLPSIFEELWFRGVLYREYKGVPVKTTAIITGLFFGVWHMNFHQAIYAALLGIMMTYLVYFTRTILAPILMHFIINSLGTLSLYSGSLIYHYNTLRENFVMYLIVIGGLCVISTFIMVVCFKKLKAHHALDAGRLNEAEAEAEAAPRPKVLTGKFWGVMITAFIGMFIMEMMLRSL